jgi:hypothetical protein
MRFSVDQQMHLHRCPNCDVMFAVTVEFNERRLADKANFYCPNGHTASYQESEADCLRRERDNLQQQMARVEDERAEAIAARQKAERELKRTQTRAGAGVCPCCNRSFRSLALHMKNKHPEIVPMQVKHGG